MALSLQHVASQYFTSVEPVIPPHQPHVIPPRHLKTPPLGLRRGHDVLARTRPVPTKHIAKPISQSQTQRNKLTFLSLTLLVLTQTMTSQKERERERESKFTERKRKRERGQKIKTKIHTPSFSNILFTESLNSGKKKNSHYLFNLFYCYFSPLFCFGFCVCCVLVVVVVG